MKKVLLMSAILVSVAASAAPTVRDRGVVPMELSTQEERIQIKPDALPNPVKQTIAGDETLKEFPVAEAWQFKSVDGTITFKVGFDNGTADKLWKTYDPEGIEIKE